MKKENGGGESAGTIDGATHLARGHKHRGKILGVEKDYRVRNAGLIRAGAERGEEERRAGGQGD